MLSSAFDLFCGIARSIADDNNFVDVDILLQAMVIDNFDRFVALSSADFHSFEEGYQTACIVRERRILEDQVSF